ncbi:XRE family transcriptional regulator [Actinomadura spongiicola]|uniref:XRE family transcriptional regulator n=1 Tax=Actinomadura spongiicola TaxID=2303421 RepID=A0A372GAU3_9ACTN|nr:helix-turn-helix domain-containing protein [Actinomadura spongiicola]RFS82259.1 XRE family transcriptional regulator [Actinomadura spongiicola]
MTGGEELARLLAEQYARADVSLRELELRSNKAGGTRLPRATCSDMLAGRRFPKKAVMLAFLRACQVPESQLPDWERAWERVKISQISAVQATVAQLPEAARDGREVSLSKSEDRVATVDQNIQPSTGEPGRGWRRARRRVGWAVGLAAVPVLGTALGLSALIDPGPSPPRYLTDDGRAFGSGGSSQFTVTVNPAHSELRLTRRLDAIIARQTATISVDGVLAAVWQPLQGESRMWRDQSVVLPSALTVGRRRLTITNTFVASELDFNEFAYFVDQKVDGTWSRADTVDVGPAHPESEAAHHYRIIHQNWAGTRHTSYPE